MSLRSRGEIVLLAGRADTGGGRVTTYAGRALRLLRAAGASTTPLQGRDPDETLDLAREAVRGGADTLVVCGGDAMARVGAQAAAGSATRLGVIPTGAGDDLARWLGLTPRDPDAAVGAVLSGRERTIDLIRCGPHLVATAVSAGFAVGDGRPGPVASLRGRLRLLEPVGCTLEVDGETVRTEATLVTVANTPVLVGGLRPAQDADPTDGLLDVVVVAPMTRRGVSRAAPQLLGGAHLEGCSQWRARRVTVAAPGVVAYADGERIGPLPLSVEAAPGALRVLVP